MGVSAARGLLWVDDDWPCPCGPGSVARTLRPRLPVLLRYLRCKRCLPRGQICASELSGKGTSKAQRRFSKPIQARHGGTEVRHKLEKADLWKHVVPQLQRVSSYDECLPELHSLCADCIRLISEPQTSCTCCGAIGGKLLRCAGCAVCSSSAAMYCSKECQRSHWKEHKKICERTKPSSKPKASTAETGEGRRELQRAIEEDDVKAVRALLNKGIHADTPVGEFGTGLHISSLQNRMEMVRVLVENGADLNLKSSMGETPLMLAVMYGHVEMVRFYVKHGAKADVLDLYGKTLQQQMEQSHGSEEDLETIRELISCVA